MRLPLSRLCLPDTANSVVQPAFAEAESRHLPRLLGRRDVHCAVADRATAAGVGGSDPQPELRPSLQTSSGPQLEAAQLAEEERRLSEQERKVSGEEKAQVTSGSVAVCMQELPSLTVVQMAG